MARPYQLRVFKLIVFVTLFVLLIQVHAVPMKVSENKPVIMNAELTIPGYAEDGKPIFNDLTNHVYNIYPGTDGYDDYLNEHNAQMEFRNQVYSNTHDLPLKFGVKLHPKTITSLKLHKGPVYTLDGMSSGPIDLATGRLSAFEEIYEVFSEQVISLTNHWDSSTITGMYEVGRPKQKAIGYSFTDEKGQVKEEYIQEGSGVYALVQYRNLQLNSQGEHELKEFEEQIKNRDPFANIRDGGVKLCDKHVPNVFCSRGFLFLNPIEPKHPHFRAYEAAWKVRQRYEISEELLKELPFHRFKVKEDQRTYEMVDLDDNNKLITDKDKLYEIYKPIGKAQFEQKNDYYSKQRKHQVPIFVFRLPKKDGAIYVQRSEEGEVLKKYLPDDPEYWFAEWSYEKVQETNAKLSELKDELEKGKVYIQAKVTDPSVTPVFMINHNPEEIPFQDPRYELIRYYYLENLRKGNASR